MLTGLSPRSPNTLRWSRGHTAWRDGQHLCRPLRALRGRRSSRCRNCSSASAGICLRRPDDIAVGLIQIVAQGRFGNAHHFANFFDGVVAFVMKLQHERPFDGIEPLRVAHPCGHAYALRLDRPGCAHESGGARTRPVRRTDGTPTAPRWRWCQCFPASCAVLPWQFRDVPLIGSGS